jgi:flagellar protein FlaJ
MHAMKIFGRFLKGKNFEKLKNSLRKARIKAPAERYATISLMLSCIICVMGGIFGYFILDGFFKLPTMYVFILTPVIAFTLGFLGYRLFLLYPSLVAKNRKSEIDAMLMHAVAYMYALSKGGIGIVDIFKSLSMEKDEFKEISKEASEIARDVEFLGVDPPTAIHNTAQTTPSEKFREFLELLIPVIKTGADLSEYFAAKCKQYYAEASTEQKRFLDTLGFLAEFYVIILGLGPLLAVISLLVMAIMGTFSVFLLYLVTYLAIPLGSAFFIIFLKAISKPTLRERKPRRIGKPETKMEEEKLKTILKEGRIESLKKTLGNPFRFFYEKPSRTLLFFLPLAAALIGVQIYSGQLSTSSVFYFSMISMLPFTLFYELRSKRVEKIEDAMPDFLTALSSGVSSGLTLSHAIKTLATSELGALSEEVRRIRKDLEWGSSTSEALEMFESRVPSGIVSHSVTVINKASQASEEIGDVLSILASDLQTSKALRQERRATMITYAIIVYISFSVFLLASYILFTSFFPLFGRGPSGPLGAPGVNLAEVKLILFHAAMLQGFCSGLIVGQLSAGRILAGMKHSLIMMAMAFSVFTFLVG